MTETSWAYDLYSAPYTMHEMRKSLTHATPLVTFSKQCCKVLLILAHEMFFLWVCNREKNQENPAIESYR